MQLFYGTDINGNTMTLSEPESSHCCRVLRMNAGDAVDMTDGKGHFYKGTILLSHDKKTIIEIEETKTMPPLPYQLHLYVAITKQADRLEWMLEKCIEMGLSSFTPIISHRTERKNIRVDRLELIALSAMKQSLKAWLPVVHPAMKLTEVLKSNIAGTKLLAHCNTVIERKPLTALNPKGETHIFIGPEGDFTPDEVALAIDKDFQSISLGESRLRTETAGLMACSFMYWNNINTQ